MQSIVPVLMLWSVLFPTRQWVSPTQPLDVTCKSPTPVTLILSDFTGSTIAPTGPAELRDGQNVDVKTLYPTLAKAGTFYSSLNDARRGVSRSLLYTMMNAFTADGTRDQAKEVRNCLALTIETLHSYFSLFTQNYPSSLIARGWVDVASAFLADFRQMITDNSQK